MIAHLMKFVDCGSDAYAVHAAGRYAKNNPWDMTGLKEELIAEIEKRKATKVERLPVKRPRGIPDSQWRGE